MRDAASRIRRVDDALFWRCAAACEQAAAQVQLSVGERAVLEGTMRHYRAGMPLDPAFKLAAQAVIDAVRERRRFEVLDAVIGRRVRELRARRRRVGSRAKSAEPSNSQPVASLPHTT